MKILMVVHGFAPECSGGTESYVLRLAAELRGLRHDVEVLCGSHEGRPVVEVETTRVEGIKVHRLHRSGLFVDDWDKSYAPEIEPALDKIVRTFKPDLVHVHHWIRLSRHLIEAFHERGVPAVCTLHDFWTTCPLAFRIRDNTYCERPVGAASCHDCAKQGENADDAENAAALDLFRDDFRNELSLARRVLVPSNAHKREILRYVPALEGRLRVVPFAPVSNLRASPEARRPAADGRLRVRHWGQFSKFKGVDVILRAAAMLPENLRRRLDLKLLGPIVYPGERDELMALAEAAGARITERPFTPTDLEREPADLAVFASRASETYSFVVDEAIQLGLPLFVSTRGAPAERVMGGGESFDPDRPEELARLLAIAIEEPAALERWRAGLPPLRSFSGHAGSVEDLYREVVASRAPLEQTPVELRRRRARFRSLQVEARNRRLEFLRGEANNLAEDARRASATMEEMDRAHRDKDAVLSRLASDVGSLADRLGAREAEIAARDLAIAARDAAIEAARVAHEAAASRLASESSLLQTQAAQARADAAARAARFTERAEAMEAETGRRVAEALKDSALRAAVREQALGDAVAAVGSLQAELRAQAGIVASLRSGLAAEQAGRLDAARRASTLDQAKREAESELAALKAEFAARAAEIASLRAALATVESSLASQSALADRRAAEGAEMAKRLAASEETVADFEINLEEHVDKLTELHLAVEDLQSMSAAERAEDRELARAAVDRLNALRAVFAGAEWTPPRDGESNPLFSALRTVEKEAAESLANAGEERTRLMDALFRRDAVVTELARAVDRYERAEGRSRDSYSPEDAPTPVAPKPLAERLKLALFGDDRRPLIAARLKVLMVVHQFLPRHVAGTEVYTAGLLQNLKAMGNEVALMTCEAHHHRMPFERLRRTQDGVPVHEIVQNYRWSSFEATYDCPPMDALFEAVLDEERPDVVHVQHLHYFSANFLVIAARRGIPVVYTLHDFGPMCARDGQLRRADGDVCFDAIPDKCADCIAHHRLDPNHVPARHRDADAAAPSLAEDARTAIARVRAGLAPLDDASHETPRDLYVQAAAERLAAWKDALSRVDLFVSPSRFLKQIFVASGLIPEAKILVSDNGQDVARFDSAPARVKGPRLRVGYVGTIAEHKGIHVLVEAMNAFAGDDRVECRIWGAKDAFVEYTAALESRIANRRTTLEGPFRNDEIAKVLSELDVLVVPSLWFENSPLTVHEAALSKLPVIVSDQGGLAEYVEEGVNGVRFFMGDVEDLRRKIAWFVEDPSRVEGFRYDRVPMTSIADDARAVEQRYRRVIADRRGT